MIGAIKFLAGIGFVAPVVGVVGAYVATSKTISPEQQTLSTVSHSLEEKNIRSSSQEFVESTVDTEDTHRDVQETLDPATERTDPDPSSSSIVAVTQTLEQHAEEETTGNCTVTISLKQVIAELQLSESDYVAVSCNGPSSDDTILTEKWTGIFPKSLLRNGEKFVEGKQLSIENWTDEPQKDATDDFYTTKFRSSQFVTEDSQITGKWEYGDKDYDDKKVDFVKLTHPTITEKCLFGTCRWLVN
ncbi:hypothetical protein DNK47_03170 [Mycoplasma wenyonii]|uniref:Uncharacterized protein n=1 Tax=Mycoplasma wenyonii TaxID=65123 RepID=A0A328PSS1_9MOLU|nr:hypothetical protein [Mycoplasma wenyonii]RAO94790.1 hypothetical protein DNK47_03170 [Mycoplasma wenyonii]